MHSRNSNSTNAKDNSKDNNKLPQVPKMNTSSLMKNKNSNYRIKKILENPGNKSILNS